MTFGEFVKLPEARYIALPIAASLLSVFLTAFSRPRLHKKLVKADFKIGLGWSITAILLWSFEAAAAENSSASAHWAWWTPVALVVLLATSTFVILEYGWDRDDRDALKEPLQFSSRGMLLSLLLGAMSLMVLYIQMRPSHE